MKKKIYVHMGLAKCASTSIQHAIHSNPYIDFAGLQPIHETGRHWATAELAWLFDQELRFNGSDLLQMKHVLTDYVECSKQDKVAFSSENLCLRFLPWDSPLHTKHSILRQIMPENTHYLVVFKSPYKLLKSLYKDWLCFGFSQSFEQFCTQLFRLQAISFFPSLRFGEIQRLVEERFGKTKCRFLMLEQHDFTAQLSEFYGETFTLPSSKKNVSFSDRAAIATYRYNRENAHSADLFSCIELHRLNIAVDDDVYYANARTRKKLQKLGQESELEVDNLDVGAFYRIPAVVADDLIKHYESIVSTKTTLFDKRIITSYIEELYDHKL